MNIILIVIKICYSIITTVLYTLLKENTKHILYYLEENATIRFT
jgi:hypothetical protein